MKIRNIIIGLLVCSFVIFGAFTLTACGEVPVTTVQETYERMKETYEKYASAQEGSIFTLGKGDGLEYNITISYGQEVNKKVAASSEGGDGFAELKTIYNSIFAISHDYIMQNESYFDGLTDSDLSDASKKALKSVNDSLNAFINAIPHFVSERNILEKFLEDGIVDEGGRAVDTYLRAFKRIYGDFVAKNIKASTSIANFIETTEFFNIIKSTELTAGNFELVKDYIRAKMLPIYSTFMMSKIENNFNFKGSDKGDGYTKVDNLLTALKTSFYAYKARLVTVDEIKSLPADSNDQNQRLMSALFDYAEIFFTEVDSYYKALNGIDFESLAIKYENNLDAYRAVNKDVDRYFDKLEQFIIGSNNPVSNTIGNFIDEVCSIIY